MGSLVQLFKSAYKRLAGNDARAVVAAVLDKPVDDILVSALSIVFYIARANPNISGDDLLDLAIAQAADQEGTHDDIDPLLQPLADYLVAGLATMPQPIPRSLLQPLGYSLVTTGAQKTRAAAIHFLLVTYQFA